MNKCQRFVNHFTYLRGPQHKYCGTNCHFLPFALLIRIIYLESKFRENMKKEIKSWRDSCAIGLDSSDTSSSTFASVLLATSHGIHGHAKKTHSGWALMNPQYTWKSKTKQSTETNEPASRSLPTARFWINEQIVLDLTVHSCWAERRFSVIMRPWKVQHWKRFSNSFRTWKEHKLFRRARV